MEIRNNILNKNMADISISPDINYNYNLLFGNQFEDTICKNIDINIETQEEIFKQLNAQIEISKNQIEIKKVTRGIGGYIAAVFGKGSTKSEIELNKKIELLNNCKQNPELLSQTYLEITGEKLSSQTISDISETKIIDEHLSSNDKETIKQCLLKDIDNIISSFDTMVEFQGWFSKGIRKLNNILDIGTNEKEAKAQIQELKTQISKLNPNSPDFNVKFKAITGKYITQDNINKLNNGKPIIDSSKTFEFIYDYKQTQKTTKKITSGITVGLVTAASVIALPFSVGTSIALGAAVGGITKALIDRTDTINTGKNYSVKENLLDFSSGIISSIASAFAIGRAHHAGSSDDIALNDKNTLIDPSNGKNNTKNIEYLTKQGTQINGFSNEFSFSIGNKYISFKGLPADTVTDKETSSIQPYSNLGSKTFKYNGIQFEIDFSKEYSVKDRKKILDKIALDDFGYCYNPKIAKDNDIFLKFIDLSVEKGISQESAERIVLNGQYERALELLKKDIPLKQISILTSIDANRVNMLLDKGYSAKEILKTREISIEQLSFLIDKNVSQEELVEISSYSEDKRLFLIALLNEGYSFEESKNNIENTYNKCPDSQIALNILKSGCEFNNDELNFIYKNASESECPIEEYIKGFKEFGSKLCTSGLSPEVISQAIKYKVNPEDVISLKNNGYSDKNIATVLSKGINPNDAIKLKNSGISDFAQNLIINFSSNTKDIDTLINLCNTTDAPQITLVFGLLSGLNEAQIHRIYEIEGSWDAVALKHSIEQDSKGAKINQIMSNVEAYKALSPETKKIFDEAYGDDFGNIVSELEASTIHIITPTKVNTGEYGQAYSGFFANSNPKIEQTIKSINIESYAQHGLPLKYPRESFISDIENIMKDLNQTQKDNIYKKLGISRTGENIKHNGYEGIIDITKLDSSGLEGEVLSKAKQFILNNKFVTDNLELNDALNSLIKGFPEFINIVGKKQHEGQAYSLDIHMLTMLKEALNNPEYGSLPDKDKTVLKIVAIFHDIAKVEGVKDDNHANISARYVKDILDKSPALGQETKDRIYELIQNHHWLESYNTKKVTPETIATLFRRKNDYKIAKILAEADIKANNSEVIFLDALKENSQRAIKDAINSLNSNGQLIFTSKVITQVPLSRYTDENGKTYNIRVVDFTKISDDNDLSPYGFIKGTKKKDIRLLVHMVDDNSIVNSITTVCKLQDAAGEGYLCTSFISLNHKNTYSSNNHRFGVSIEAENANIANALNANQLSGFGKTKNEFQAALSNTDEARTYIPNAIKKELGLTDAEYQELYNKFSSKKHISQISTDKKGSLYTIGTKTFTGEKIMRAIQKSNDLLLDVVNNHDNTLQQSEINIYTPKINAIVAKVDSIKEVPNELIEYAQREDLPIYILGSDET